MKSSFPLKPNQISRLFALAIEGKDANLGEKSHSPEASVCQDRTTAKLPDWIGRYKIRKILGEGGMGIVYLADQEHPVKRTVALKIIKPGMDSKQVITRFEAELQTLASLDHPNIAHVYDAGTTKEGRPYFAMEYVQGLPITDYCDSHKLPLKDRLHLFLRVCDAVQHAHQRGIIHRDIKPTNILVTSENDKAVPKIIDFGVAKALNIPLSARPLSTEQGQLLGTPEYMSPEQIECSSKDIDTRTDVYSLGVLLYELLTGFLPFDSRKLREGGSDTARRIICEEDPKTPSTRLIEQKKQAVEVAQRRNTEVDALARQLQKELEWIPLKAMRKERAERYRSTSELADDIENYLKGAPLLAGPESKAYLIKKFVRRKRALVTSIATVSVVLISGIVASTLFAIGQARARAEAQLIADFLENDVLGSVREAKVGEASVSYILDAASKSLEGKFKDRPLIEARICEKLGRMYYILSDPTKAEPHLLKAIRIYQKYNNEQHAIALGGALDTLGWVYMNQDRLYDAEHLWTKSLRIRQRVGNVEGQVFAMNALGTTYKDLGKYKDAELLFEKVLQVVQRELGEENVPHLPYYKCNLAEVYGLQGRYGEAEQLFVEMLENAEWPETYGKSWELQYAYQLGNVYIEQGSYDKAETLFVKTLKIQRLERGDEHRHTLLTMCGLARLYTTQNHYDEAEALFSEILEIDSRRRGEDHRETLRFMNGYAVLLTKQKRYDEAEPLFKKALEGRQQKLYEDHPDTLESKHDLAMLYKEQEWYDQAEVLLLEAIEGRRLKLGDKHPHTIESINNLIDLYEAWNKPEKVEEWRSKLSETGTGQQQ